MKKVKLLSAKDYAIRILWLQDYIMFYDFTRLYKTNFTTNHGSLDMFVVNQHLRCYWLENKMVI